MNDAHPSNVWQGVSASLTGLQNLYARTRRLITKRLKEFRDTLRRGSAGARLLSFARNEEGIFAELAFCLLTPQSDAHRCWNAVELLRKKNILMCAPAAKIAHHLFGVRFHNNKSRYICAARRQFTEILTHLRADSAKALATAGKDCPTPELRQWLAMHIKGLGYKEASHFLRNIGLGDRIAILDRHILRNLVRFHVIPRLPRTMTPKQYLIIEERMRQWARKIRIPLAHLDLLLWFKEKGEIFK
ncbi:MAG: N-glycosylase/DNA lyase [Candidatus Sumerlaeota bacterium]|nr:N-glycosylase/DNA lyase [Candidatus Sumerlaeota bacterium]